VSVLNDLKNNELAKPEELSGFAIVFNVMKENNIN